MAFGESPYDYDPETGILRDPPPAQRPLTLAGQLAESRERAIATDARYALIDRQRMAEEVQLLICTALKERAQQLRDMGDHDVEADKTADLARMVRMLRDPVPLAAALGLS
jgi:hypothetical protein